MSRERLMRRALAQTQLPGCLGARTGMPPWWMSLVDVLVRLGMPPRWRSWCWMFVHHTKRSSQTPTDAYAPLYSLGAKALLLWGRAPPLHTPSCHVLAPRREPITCDDGLFIGTNKADDRDGTYTRSGWGLPSPRLRMQSNLQLPPRRANRGCGEHSADGEAGEVGQVMDSRQRRKLTCGPVLVRGWPSLSIKPRQLVTAVGPLLKGQCLQQKCASLRTRGRQRTGARPMYGLVFVCARASVCACACVMGQAIITHAL